MFIGSYVSNQSFQVALIQISFKDRSYLIDKLSLEIKISDSDWAAFFEKLLCSEGCLKLGLLFIHIFSAALMFGLSVMETVYNLERMTF